MTRTTDRIFARKCDASNDETFSHVVVVVVVVVVVAVAQPTESTNRECENNSSQQNICTV